jgi:putative nucleotidyltransferase with HDIG domain
MSAHLVALPEVSQRLCKLPVYWPVAARIWEGLDARAGRPEITHLISLDAAITAEILVAANSPVSGFSSSIYDVHEALAILDWDHVKRLLHAAVAGRLEADVRTEPLIQASWTHSLATAFFASELAPFFGIPKDQAYTLGLMHDIGRLGMLATYPGPYLDVVARTYGSSLECLGAEECVLGMSHCKAGLWLARVWGLPAEFAESAAAHHAMVIEAHWRAARLTAVACRLAHAGGFVFERCQPVHAEDAISIAPAESLRRLQPRLGEIEARGRSRLLQSMNGFRQWDPAVSRN